MPHSNTCAVGESIEAYERTLGLHIMTRYSVTHLSECISVIKHLLLYFYLHKDLDTGLPCYHSYREEHKDTLGLTGPGGPT